MSTNTSCMSLQTTVKIGTRLQRVLAWVSVLMIYSFVSCAQNGKNTKTPIIEKEINKEKHYLSSDYVFYNQMLYTGEPNFNNIWVPIHIFKENIYSKVEIRMSSYSDGKWKKLSSVECEGNKIDNWFVFNADSLLIERKLYNGGKEELIYDLSGRITSRVFFSPDGKVGSILKSEYLNTNTVILTESFNEEVYKKKINSLNKSGLLVKSVVMTDNKVDYTLTYSYDNKNRPSRLTVYMGDNYPERIHYEYLISYQENKFGDWTELLVEALWSTDEAPMKHSKLERIFYY